AAGAGVAGEAATAVFVRRAAMDGPSSPDVIAESYKLTPTELRVLTALVEIGGVPEVAAALGVAETTVKTHLGRLFAKTGPRRPAGPAPPGGGVPPAAGKPRLTSCGRSRELTPS